MTCSTHVGNRHSRCKCQPAGMHLLKLCLCQRLCAPHIIVCDASLKEIWEVLQSARTLLTLRHMSEPEHSHQCRTLGRNTVLRSVKVLAMSGAAFFLPAGSKMSGT